MNKRRIKGHYTIVDTFNATEMYNRASFEDYCSACDEDGRYNVESDEDWHKWAYEESEMDLDYLFDNLRFCKGCNYPVIVEGELGLWWGKPMIEQRFFYSVDTAVSECINGADYVIIKKAGNHLEIEALHHDGCNSFSITFLTPKGEARYHKNGKVSTSNKENYVKLPEYLY